MIKVAYDNEPKHYMLAYHKNLSTSLFVYSIVLHAFGLRRSCCDCRAKPTQTKFQPTEKQKLQRAIFVHCLLAFSLRSRFCLFPLMN